MRQNDTVTAPGNLSIAALYDRHAYNILNYIARYIASREDVQDLVLDVFLAAMENQAWLPWSEGEQLAWLRRVAYHKVIDHYRRTSRHPSVELAEISMQLSEDDEALPEHIALRNEAYHILRLHLSNLSALQQEIILLRFGHGLRLKEIAQRLHKSEGVIRVTLSRTLNHLRRLYLQQEGV